MARSSTRPVDQCTNLLRELTIATTGFMGSDLQSQGEETFPIPIDIISGLTKLLEKDNAKP